MHALLSSVDFFQNWSNIFKQFVSRSGSTVCKDDHQTILAGEGLRGVLCCIDGQDGRGKVLFEDHCYASTIPSGKIMHATSSQLLSTLFTKKQQQHMNNTMTIPTLIFLTSWLSLSKTSFHSKMVSKGSNLRVSRFSRTPTRQK